MKAAFEWFTPDGAKAPVEFVRITLPKGDMVVSDEVFREATDKDRSRWFAAYREFKGSAPPKQAEPKAESKTEPELPADVAHADAATLPEPPPEFMAGFSEPAAEAAADDDDTKTEHTRHKRHR